MEPDVWLCSRWSIISTSQDYKGTFQSLEFTYPIICVYLKGGQFKDVWGTEAGLLYRRWMRVSFVLVVMLINAFSLSSQRGRGMFGTGERTGWFMGKERLLPQIPKSRKGEWHWKATGKTEAFWCEVCFGSCESATFYCSGASIWKGADSVSSPKPSEAYFLIKESLEARSVRPS